MKEYYEINREILNQSFISEINENPNNKDDNHMYDTENRNENDDIPKDSKNQNTLKNKKNNISIKLEKQEKGKVKSSYIGKKRGRKTNNSTEIGSHTSDSDDNKRRKHWRTFLKKIIKCVNELCKKAGELKATNFIDQFGSSSVQNSDFTKLKIYKYFIFIKNKKKKGKKERKGGEIGQKNKEIIIKMVNEENNDVFKALMKNTIKDMYLKYVKNEKFINIKGTEKKLTQFDTINDVIEEKKAEYKRKNYEDIEERIKSLKEESTSLIDFIVNIKKRKRRKNNSQL